MSKVAMLYPDTVTMSLRTFPGAKVVALDKPIFCHHCDKDLLRKNTDLSMLEFTALLEKRRGNIIDRVWPDGRHEWACHRCGRATVEQTACDE